MLSLPLAARRTLLLLVALAFALPGFYAAADEPGEVPTLVPAEEEARSRPTGVEVITVTARKREERLQETPVAITNFSETDLRDQQVERLDTIMQNVPNLVMGTAVFQIHAASIFLRGVGNGNPGLHHDSAIGIYVDGVYFPRAQSRLMNMADIQRVEVLRGPQGTLYGKNTIGGLVNVITQKPDFDGFHGYVQIRAGNYDTLNTKTSINVPLIGETLAARFAFATRTSDGYMKNKIHSGDDANNDRLLGGRASFLWQPAEDWEFLLTASTTTERRENSAPKCKWVGGPITTRPDPDFFGLPGPFLDDPIPTGQSDQSAAPPSGLIQGFILGGVLLDLPAYRQSCLDDEFGRDELSFVSDVPHAFDELHTYAFNLTSTWDLSEHFTLKSITAWEGFSRHDALDVDATEFGIVQNVTNAHSKQDHNSWSEELSLNGRMFDDRLNLTVGAYFFKEDNRESDKQTLPFIPSSQLRSRNLRHINNWNRGFFGQATFDITEQLSLTAGVRHIHERRRVWVRSLDGPDAWAGIRCPVGYGLDEAGDPTIVDCVTFEQYEHSIRFDKWTPMYNLTYRVTDDLMLYAGWSRGFKSGIWDDRNHLNPTKCFRDGTPVPDTGPGSCPPGFDYDPTEPGAAPAEPETISSWEVGFKSTLFDNRLMFNVAGFINTWENAQLTVVTVDKDGNLIIQDENAGKVRSLGLEIETRAVPFAGLTLTSSLGIQSSRYAEFEACAGPAGCTSSRVPNDPRSGPYSNNKLPGNPTYQWNVAASYVLPLLDIGDLRTRVSWFMQTKAGNDILDQHWTRADKFGVMNARTVLELADGVTQVALYCTNCLDRRYFESALNLGFIGSAIRFYAPPRQYGIEVRREF